MDVNPLSNLTTYTEKIYFVLLEKDEWIFSLLFSQTLNTT